MKRERKRPGKGFTLWTAVVWTLMTAAWLWETVHRRGLYFKGYAGWGEICGAGVLAAVSAFLAAYWWYSWFQRDKRERDGASDNKKTDE